MTLKSIELFGFKSFGKKSVISFNTPIVSIVGPNGSGKSNIVEAMRFVLGEQSIKSLRSKGGVDLIYKGSKISPASSRASVAITFDNSQKIFAFTNSGNGVSLDYDDITIARTVYPDGVNKYSINSTEVRLKDIVDLLGSVNIGSSGHQIISQGEADRVLNASNKDRRTMIEDALGLKVFQYRILESEKKLSKTIENMKEVSISRREVAPHLNFLKKQVQKVEKVVELRNELDDIYKNYLPSQSKYILNETNRLTHLRRSLDENILSLDERINKIEAENKVEKVDDSHKNNIKKYEEELRIIRNQKDELVHKLGRIEGVIEGIDRELARVPVIKENIVTESQWRSVVSNIERYIDDCLSMSDMTSIFSNLKSIKESIASLSVKTEVPVNVDESIKLEKEELIKNKEGININLKNIEIKEKEILEQLSLEKDKEREDDMATRESQVVLFDLQRQKSEFMGDLKGLVFAEEKINLIKDNFEKELAEAGVLIGRNVLEYMKLETEVIDSNNAQETSRRIERIKFKLEDAGVSNSGDILKEYQDTVDRDIFLEKEVNDLQQSVESLNLLIIDLKENLDTQFKIGVEKINQQFQEFFSLMFGGGSAFLSVVMEHKKVRKNKDEDPDMTDIDKDENEIGFERGIEINVTLPQKKVKDIHMLSGGERSLTSIALLFAISQVNPPPFLVLDETDAALDEANSRKYGNMLENLAHFSQLVVVTHNRETMSRAQVLYGVTVGADGCSKLLSIKLEDASVYAK